MMRALVYTGGVTARGAKLCALMRFTATRRVHDSAEDEDVRRDARLDWLAYEASVVSVNGARSVCAARSTERAPRSPSLIARAAREGKWPYTADAVVRKLSSALTLDSSDLGASIDEIVLAARPMVEPVRYGGEFARLEAAQHMLVAICAPCVAAEIAALRISDIHSAILCVASRVSALVDITDPAGAVHIANAAHIGGACGMRRLFADAACLLHAAGLSDHVGVVLNRVGPAEFDTYAAALAAGK